MPLPNKIDDPHFNHSRVSHGNWAGQVPATVADPTIEANFDPDTIFDSFPTKVQVASPPGKASLTFNRVGPIGTILAVTVYLLAGTIKLRPRYWNGVFSKWTKQLPAADEIDATVDPQVVTLLWNMVGHKTAIWVEEATAAQFYIVASVITAQEGKV
jgi:hypothetical protein